MKKSELVKMIKEEIQSKRSALVREYTDDPVENFNDNMFDVIDTLEQCLRYAKDKEFIRLDKKGVAGNVSTIVRKLQQVLKYTDKLSTVA